MGKRKKNLDLSKLVNKGQKGVRDEGSYKTNLSRLNPSKLMCVPEKDLPCIHVDATVTQA